MYVKTLKPFTYLDNGNLFSPSAGSICNVTDDLGNSWIEDGLAESYNLITPTGTKTITSNGTDIDVSTYARADVAVPVPEGNIEITQNGTGIDIADYSTATVAVPEPTGSLEITSNDTYDVTNYAQVIVNVTG